MLDALRHDLKHAFRALVKSRGFSAIAIASLAIGIAGNAAIFSVADAVLLRPLPGIADPDRLVDIGRTQRGNPIDTMSYPNFADLRERSTVFQGLSAYRPMASAFGLTVDGSAQQAYGTEVSANYFDVAGVSMTAGRAFGPDQDRIERAPAVMVLSYSLWERRFNGDRGVVGRTVRLNGEPFTIVGVARPGFTGTNMAIADFWIPMGAYGALMSPGAAPNDVRAASQAFTSRAIVWMAANGRLKPGVTLAQARDEVSRIARDLEREYPEDNRGRSIGVEPSRPVPAPGRTPAALFLTLLFALVFLILLIACTNIGGMLLARGVARAREVALRLALGASHTRIVRLLVAESLLLSFVGAIVGLGLSLGFIQLLGSIIPALPIHVGVDLRIDWRVVAFSAVLAMGTALLCGLLPALETAKVDLLTSFRADTSTRGSRRHRLRHMFVVSQMAMSVLLLVAALLLGRSLKQAGVIDPGFVVDNVDAVRLDLLMGGHTDARGGPLAEDLLQRIQQLPGVQSAAITRGVPLTLAGFGLGPLRPAGQPFDLQSAIFPDWGTVSPRYFDTLRIPIVRGRAFEDGDRAGAPEVVIINETLARRLFADEDPIGKTLVNQTGPPPSRERQLQVVGVARDGKYRTLGEEPRAFVYAPAAQQYNSQLWILARTSGPRVLAAMQATVRDLDANLPILQSGSLSEVTAFGLLPQRIAAWIAGSVGLIALLLAMIGVYGLTSHSVAQRRREIGIRMALGALRGQVLRMSVSRSLWLTAIGSAIGLAFAAGAAQLMSGLLYGISPLDPISFGGAVVVLGVVALAGSAIAARRAASVNPVEALRAE
jgi:predicted permease